MSIRASSVCAQWLRTGRTSTAGCGLDGARQARAISQSEAAACDPQAGDLPRPRRSHQPRNCPRPQGVCAPHPRRVPAPARRGAGRAVAQPRGLAHRRRHQPTRHRKRLGRTRGGRGDARSPQAPPARWRRDVPAQPRRAMPLQEAPTRHAAPRGASARHRARAERHDRRPAERRRRRARCRLPHDLRRSRLRRAADGASGRGRQEPA